MLELVALVGTSVDDPSRKTKVSGVLIHRLLKRKGSIQTRVASVLVQRLVKVNP
ncbi:hypothetical protein pEaSNUABM37_00340 [Erwinia phage pEa_SNUABM_37]|nr:hypothetical protein pEaSNUABM37_00340 [Erwinia phage pEa_SNUABM_37]QXO10808.1 hypothetical protein pEaSNUABM48_00340 [Erwinia phage pEa_SNUABM_48]